jgi:hypothetical protein
VPSIPYDASRGALLHPGLRATVFGEGGPTLQDIDAICAECSRLSYLHFENSGTSEAVQFAAALAAGGLVGWQGFDAPDTDTHAFAVSMPSTGNALLVFRGTEADKATDIGVDLAATLIPWSAGGRVHSGFARAFSGIRAAIEAWLAQHLANQRLVVTGHSLGAALATLAASFWKDTTAVTFGSPRVGDAEFIQTLAPDRMKRFVDCCDIVTQVPPRVPGLYVDTCPMLYIDRNGRLRPEISNADVDADQSAARSTYLTQDAWVTGNVLARDLADHAPINYVRAFV